MSCPGVSKFTAAELAELREFDAAVDGIRNAGTPEGGEFMISVRELCAMADALMENRILSYGTTYTPDLSKKIKYLQVSGIENVQKFGDSFRIEYISASHIEFTTHQFGFDIMCLIDYPQYQDWMREHPDTVVHDCTKGRDKNADVLHR